jgi:hypothetical protein
MAFVLLVTNAAGAMIPHDNGCQTEYLEGSI